MKKVISLLLALAIMLSLVPITFAASDHAGFDNFQKTADYYEGRFTDVKSTDWFSTGIQIAYMLGLMNGSSDTKFSPNGDITIAETLTIACRIHSTYHGKDIDISNNSASWYQPYIDYAIQNRMILSKEYSDYTKQASRANFANMIYAALPADAWTKINSVDKLPDVVAGEWYSTQVFALYNAGILTGSDKYGTFNPSSNITRGEVATIITRVAVPSARQTFTLESRQAVNEFLKSYLTSKDNNSDAYTGKYTDGARLLMTIQYKVDENKFNIRVAKFGDNTAAVTELSIPYSLGTPYSGRQIGTDRSMVKVYAIGEFSINPRTFTSDTVVTLSNFDYIDNAFSSLKNVMATTAAPAIVWMLSTLDSEILEPNGYTLKDLGFTNL